jgi:hypothetical protein
MDRAVIYVDDPDCGGWWIVCNGVDPVGPFESALEAIRALVAL